MSTQANPSALGLDFGTTNSVVALAGADGASSLVDFQGEHADGPIFRSALCFWEDTAIRGGLGVEAGPWAIAEYLEFPEGSRFIQSFKSMAASAAFEHANIFEKRLRFEEIGQRFLKLLVAHAGGKLDRLPERIIVGRPVEFAGGRPDPVLARERYDLMFREFGTEVHYAYEPLGAAFAYANRLSEPATIMVADFGGGTSDFSIVRVAEPGSARRCTPLGSAGIGIAGDRFDYRIVDRLILPMLGMGGSYRSFDKILDIPRGYFSDFADWARLALMRNRKTLADLEKLRKNAIDPEAIGRMIAVIENELGYRLYDAVGRLKKELSRTDTARLVFEGGGLELDVEVARTDFENWIADDIARINATVDRALTAAGTDAAGIDRVFLTGGSSLIPAIRSLFEQRFGAERIAVGGELTSIAQGLALIGQEPDLGPWSV